MNGHTCKDGQFSKLVIKTRMIRGKLTTFEFACACSYGNHVVVDFVQDDFVARLEGGCKKKCPIFVCENCGMEFIRLRMGFYELNLILQQVYTNKIKCINDLYKHDKVFED